MCRSPPLGHVGCTRGGQEVVMRSLSIALFSLALALCAIACGQTSDNKRGILPPDSDAVVLTIRLQETIALDRELLSRVAPALARARTARADLAELHARPEFESRSVLLGAEGQVAERFAQGELH